jgi:hypothetical protein
MGGVKRASHVLRAIRREHRPDRRPGMRRIPACLAAGSNFAPALDQPAFNRNRLKAEKLIDSKVLECVRKSVKRLSDKTYGSQSLLPRFSILLRSSESSNILPFAITLSCANYCKLVWRFYHQLRELIQA